MTRYFSTTAMAVSLTAICAVATPASAACVAGGSVTEPSLTCTGTDIAPIDDARDNLSVIFDASAALVAPTGLPIALSGSDQSLDNSGVIESMDSGENAIEGTGPALTVTNSGTIRGGDRGIVLEDDADDFTLHNLSDGEIFARRQAVRLDDDFALTNTTVTNDGLIQSIDGRAIQSRGPGTTIINTGTLRGGEEVVEAREDFSLTNTGTIALNGLDWDAGTQSWTNDGATSDEDGVQFASGALDNSGVILGTDDGIDLDEGTITNRAGGVILSTGAADDPLDGGSGIDVDETFEPTVGDDRAAGPLSIVNAGYIEGVRAIGTNDASESEITIANSGTLRGRSGTAIELAPGQGNSSLTISGDSAIFGDVIFGGGDDLLTVGNVSAGPLINSVFDGGAGDNTVRFADLALGDVTTLRFGTGRISLGLATEGGLISGDFQNFGFWQFGDDEALSTSAFLAAVPQATPVPVPAGLPLLVTALGGLAWLRRRTGRV